MVSKPLIPSINFAERKPLCYVFPAQGHFQEGMSQEKENKRLFSFFSFELCPLPLIKCKYAG